MTDADNKRWAGIRIHLRRLSMVNLAIVVRPYLDEDGFMIHAAFALETIEQVVDFKPPEGPDQAQFRFDLRLLRLSQPLIGRTQRAEIAAWSRNIGYSVKSASGWEPERELVLQERR